MLSALVLAALAGTWVFRQQSGTRAGRSGAIDALVEAAMTEGGITGASVGILERGRIIHARGYGLRDVENMLPDTEETVYGIGSITKQFTAAAIMRLAETGQIRLDGHISEYLPGYPTHAMAVTIRSLLNHTSGIPNYTLMESWWRTMAVEMAPREVIRVFENEPLDFASGSRFSYSNSGYFLLGLIVEEVSGRPFGGYLNEEFFIPLGLGSTRYCDRQALIPDRASGYKFEGGSLVHAAFVSPSQAYSAGAVCSNVLDLMRWSRALEEGIAVGKDSYLEMTSPGSLTDGSEIEYGMGLAISHLDGHRRVTHVGGTLGFSSQIARYPDDELTVVVLTNTEDAKAANIETGIARMMFGLRDNVLHDILLEEEEMAPYTGTYDLGPTVVTVMAGDGRLEVDVPLPGLEGRYTLLYQGGLTFQAESDSEISVTFTVTNGTVGGFVLVRKGITMRGDRIA
jgi:CubicO group peptidase (beta-lactamase class C family)